MKYLATVRAWAREYCTLDVLLLGMMVIAASLASVGFWFGKVCASCYFCGAVAISFVVACLAGWRRTLAFVLTLLGCFVLTAYTFSYTGTDAQNYHFPMQWLLREGWNPIFDSTIEKFTAVVNHPEVDILKNGWFISALHVLFLPKFTSLCGALVAKATGLWVADAFLGYVLIISLFTGAFRFARRMWKCGILPAVLFALALVFSTKITSFLAGQVDYSAYAAILISFLSATLFARDNKLSDLFVFGLGAIVAMSVKSTGILSCGLMMILLLPLLYRRVSSWVAVLIIAVFVLLLNASPLLTAWIQYGSPFYPASTFNPSVATVDITNDFTGNADALSMGYLSRICYAWVSPQMTVKILSWLKGASDFNPVFVVCGGVKGLGLWFNALLLMSLLALIFSKKNIITYLCVILFLSSNFAPLKYIGYGRYFPQIWAIVPLAFFNFYFNGYEMCRLPIRKWTGGALVCLIMAFAALSAIRTVAYEARSLALEVTRQAALAELCESGDTVFTDNGYRFSTLERLKLAGLKLQQGKTDPMRPPVSFDGDTALPLVKSDIAARFKKQYPICDTPKALLHFPWKDAFANLPHVLWYKGK